MRGQRRSGWASRRFPDPKGITPPRHLAPAARARSPIQQAHPRPRGDCDARSSSPAALALASASRSVPDLRELLLSDDVEQVLAVAAAVQ